MGAGGPLRFALFGPVRAWRGAEQLDLGAARCRAVLAVLLLHANRPVRRESLIEAVWGESVPAYAVNQVQKYVSGLRRVLEPRRGARSSSGILNWTDGGYVLEVEPDALDLTSFELRVARGRDAQARGEAMPAAAELHEALALWDGPALANVSSPFLDAERDRLAELRVAVLEERIKADLDLGRHGKLVPELSRLVAEFPLRESFAALLMLALYRSGRQGDALATYHDVRRSLREQLGVDPGSEVREMHERILASCSSLSLREDPAEPAPGGASASTTTAPPSVSATALTADDMMGVRQLPMDISEFVGRDGPLRELWALAGGSDAAPRDGDGHGDRGARIAVIEGMAGVGKTRLAVHASHQFLARDRFPDGQLWADLKGFAPDGRPVDPARALEDFLRLLGVPGERVPESVEARAALYRDRLSGRRALIVLDNAADEEQVRHLLPGSASCLLLVTSRRVLSGLDGAHTIPLGPLSPDEAVTLLHRVAGREPDESRPGAALRVAESSGRLPIAVALAGRRLRTRPAWSMEELAGRLEHGEERLAQFTVGRRAVDATFHLSYQALSPGQQRAFRLLSVHPGEDCTPDSAAALLGTGRGQAEELLESLLDEHLMQQHVLGRYRFHDLLRLYAHGRARAEVGAERRTEAVLGLVRWYCDTAERARRRLEPWWEPLPSADGEGEDAPGGDSDGDSAPRHLADDADSAVTWLEQERANLLAAGREAARRGWHDHTWRLASAAHSLLGLRSYGTDSLDGLELGLAAARGAGDRTKEAWSLHDLGLVRDSLGLHEEAKAQHRAALALFEEADDRHGVAEAFHGLGRSSFCLGQYDESAEQQGRALALFEEIGHRRGQASALRGLGLVNWFLHRRYSDSPQDRTALVLFEEIGDRHGQAYEVTSLAMAHWFFGNYAECARQHHRALALFEGTGDRRGQAMALNGLGTADWHLGRLERARDHHQAALTVFREICDRRGEAVALQRLGYVNWAVGRYGTGEEQLRQTLAICEETGNRSTESWTHASLGYLCLRLKRYGQAEEHLRQALVLSRELHDGHPETSALIGLALVRLDEGRPLACEEGGREALALARSIGNPHNEAWALIAVGLGCCYGGRPEEAADWHWKAAAVARRTGDPFTESMALTGIGSAYTRLGRHGEAGRHLRTALDTRRRIGDRHGEADTLAELADLQEATGDAEASYATRGSSMAILAELGVPTGAQR